MQRIHLGGESTDVSPHLPDSTDAEKSIELHDGPREFIDLSCCFEHAQIREGIEMAFRQRLHLLDGAAQSRQHLPAKLLQLTRCDESISPIVTTAEIKDQRAWLRKESPHLFGDADARLLHQVRCTHALIKRALLDLLHLVASHEHG